MTKTSLTRSHAELPPDQLRDLVVLFNHGRLEEVVRQATAKALDFPNAAILYNILGAANVELGKLDGAIASFGRAVQIKPDFFEAHNNLGLALQRRYRFEEAIASFNEALRVKADDAEVHNNLGAVLRHQDRLEEAIASFSKAVQINPRFVEAHSNLCGIYERQNRLNDFETAVKKATLSCGKSNPNILFRLAQLASRKDQFEDAFGYLKNLQVESIQPSQRTTFLGLCGKVNDKLGRFSEAFSAFVRLNELVRNSSDARRYNADRYLNPILSRKAAWTASAKPAWARSTRGNSTKSPAFLVGFPRSGTTLLDTILRSHSQVAVVEEEPMVGAMIKAFAQRPAVENLNTFSEADVLGLQDIYFRELKKHFDREGDGKLIVDKLPLNIVHVDIIHRVFPDAKIILALRHPCDCVLSCFMQTFKLNDPMMNFLSLDQSAKFYAAVMELWSVYRQKLDLDVHVLKYEDLVQDLESTCKSLIGFLGLEWDENLRNYQKTALDRGKIYTPSYNQVTQPLYKQASGRWNNYREQMQPVLPVLQPWIEAFGY